MEPIEFSGNLVAIEPLRIDHAAGLLTAADADEIFAWLPYARPVDLDQARVWIEGALEDRQAHRRMPFAILNANAHVEIGSTWLSQALWGTCRNTETKLLLMTHAFEVLALERVAFRTDIRNERSQRAIERLGAIREGLHRHEMRRRDGSWRDSLHYSILSSEWPNVKRFLAERLRASCEDNGQARVSTPDSRR